MIYQLFNLHAYKNDIEQKINILYEVFQKMRLTINVSITETMSWNLNESSDSRYPELIIKIQDVEWVNTKYFKYRTKGLHRKLRKKKKQPENSCHVLKLVRLKLSYGCHPWCQILSETSKLSAVGNRILRSMLKNCFEQVKRGKDLNASALEDYQQ